MTTTTLTPTTKTTRLAKTGDRVRLLAMRLERALQSRNEKVARADADYVEAVRRATGELDDLDGVLETPPPPAPPSNGEDH